VVAISSESRGRQNTLVLSKRPKREKSAQAHQWATVMPLGER